MTRHDFDHDYFREQIAKEIEEERCRQDRLRDAGKFPWTLADRGPSDHERLAPLAEEFGEVARAVCEDDEVNLRAELIQLAACCVAWVEDLDRDTEVEYIPAWHPEPTDPDYGAAPQGAD